MVGFFCSIYYSFIHSYIHLFIYTFNKHSLNDCHAMHYAKFKGYHMEMHPLPLRHSQPSKRDHVRASNSAEGVSEIRGLWLMLWEPRAGNA